MNEKEDNKVTIPIDLFRKIEQKVKDTDFDSVSSYILGVLSKELSSEDVSNSSLEEEERKVKERLKSLGYLD